MWFFTNNVPLHVISSRLRVYTFLIQVSCAKAAHLKFSLLSDSGGSYALEGIAARSPTTQRRKRTTGIAGRRTSHSHGCNSHNLRNHPQHCYDSGSDRCYEVGWRPAHLIGVSPIEQLPPSGLEYVGENLLQRCSPRL